jgi:hypothetical protein
MWHHKLHRKAASGAKLLADVGSGLNAGIAGLPQDITINGTTVSPTFRYEGKDASLSSWTPVVGETLTAAGSGGTVGLYAPTPDETARAVDPQGTRYWEAGNNAFADPGTDDFILELVFFHTSGTTDALLNKFNAATVDGLRVRLNAGTGIRLLTYGTSNVSTDTAALPVNCWTHATVFYDASGSSQWYINGDASGSAAAVSSVGSLTQAVPLQLCSDGSNGFPKSVAYAAMWQRDNWLDTHLQADLAQERFARLTGTYVTGWQAWPTQANLRNSVATLERQTAGGVQQLFTVGARWPRLEKVPDKFNRYASGFMVEGQHTNLYPYSEAFDNAAWSKLNSTVTPNSVLAPDKEQTADTLVEDATVTTSHGVSDAVNVTDTLSYTQFVFCKPVNRSWVRLYTQFVCDVYFDVANGIVGTAALGSGFMRYIGDGWYLCAATGVASGTAGRVSYILAASGDGASTYTGLSQDAFYLWGAQFTATAYPVSYIKTDGATVTRLADSIQYNGLALPASCTIACDALERNVTLGNIRYGVISDATSNNRELVYRVTTSLLAFVQTGGVAQVNQVSTIPAVADKWGEYRMTTATDDVNLYVDGALGGSDTSATLPSGMTRLSVGCGYSNLNQLDGRVRVRLFSKPTEKDITDFGVIMSQASGYISTPAAVSVSTSYVNVGGTFTSINLSEFTLSAAGVFTYTGTDTKRFYVAGACSGSKSGGGSAQLTTVVEKNGTEVSSSESLRDVTGTAVGAWALFADLELANGDTVNFAVKLSTGTENVTMNRLSAVIIEAGN